MEIKGHSHRWIIDSICSQSWWYWYNRFRVSTFQNSDPAVTTELDWDRIRELRQYLCFWSNFESCLAAQSLFSNMMVCGESGGSWLATMEEIAFNNQEVRLNVVLRDLRLISRFVIIAMISSRLTEFVIDAKYAL